jgi:hypothetical protein
MFNVLTLSSDEGLSYRRAIGRIHVDALLAQLPSEDSARRQYETIELE